VTTYSGSLVGGYVTMTTDGGKHWTNETTSAMAGDSFSGVSCPTAAECVVVGDTAGFDYGDFTTSNFGSTWTAHTMPGTGNMDGVACPTAKTCFAVGAHLLKSTDAGASWVMETYPQQAGPLWSIACPSASRCIAVSADYWGLTGGIVATTDGGTEWNAQTPPAPTFPLSGVSCVSASTCVAVGQSGQSLLQTTDGGSIWVTTRNPDTYLLQAVACPLGGNCFAVGVDQIAEGSP
jgi:photosystem II stability/assembly factor-like uncharacterized protein